MVPLERINLSHWMEDGNIQFPKHLFFKQTLTMDKIKKYFFKRITPSSESFRIHHMESLIDVE
jgi:hypothetical protein